MLSDWFPGLCSRLRIFLSYASDQRGFAEALAQTLTNSGHVVFFDKESLPPAADYNERIRRAIRSSDRFIFLASRSALAAGRYTLTELEFARERWPSPVGRVIPVVIEPGLAPEALPAYLSSVQALSISGNAAAEIAAAIERTSGINAYCHACFAVSLLALAGVAAVAGGVLPLRASFAPAEIAIVASEFVHFRPRARPPDNPAAPGAGTAWTSSPVTVMLPIGYSHKNARSAPAQVLSEELELQIGSRTEKYAWTYVVEILSSSIVDKRCGDDWLCQKGNVKAENLAPGTRTCRQLSHRSTQTSRTPARNVLASLSKRVAIAR